MAARVFEELSADQPKRHFTVGIIDDVTHLSLKWDERIHHRKQRRDAGCVLWPGQRRHRRGNQKLCQNHRGKHAALCPRVLRLRFKKSRLCNRFTFAVQPAADSIPPTSSTGQTSSLAINFTFSSGSTCCKWPNQAPRSCSTVPTVPDDVWDHLPHEVQQQIIDKQLKFYVVDGYSVAQQAGMAGRFNTAMQACFFALARRAAA